MKHFLHFNRLRTRLILAYAGLIVAGFTILALLVGQQISNSAYIDYQQRVLSESLLISQGLQQPVNNYLAGNLADADLLTTLHQYEAQVGGQLAVYTMKQNQSVVIADKQPADPRGGPEVGDAMRGHITLTQRTDTDGQDKFFTAVPIMLDRRPLGYVQMSIPCSNVNKLLFQRWGILGLAVLGITSVALLVGIWLSGSLTRPLDKLRLSALEISKGNLGHRVLNAGQDEIGEVARAFNQMAGQVQSMIEEQRAFASNASHELRTPLTTIRLRTDALRHDTELGDSLKTQYITEIDEEAVRLSSLIEDLSLLSRFDAGRVPVGQERIELGRFARTIHQQLSRQAVKKDIDFCLNTPEDDDLPIDVNLNHLTVLFRNLLDNAIKYTSSGGKVEWDLSRDMKGILITIRDNGQGISAQDLPHVFERFYRADKAHSRAVPGTGLGLALAQAIIKMYGATMEIDSKGEGLGTTVTIRWPSQAESA